MRAATFDLRLRLAVPHDWVPVVIYPLSRASRHIVGSACSCFLFSWLFVRDADDTLAAHGVQVYSSIYLEPMFHQTPSYS